MANVARETGGNRNVISIGNSSGGGGNWTRIYQNNSDMTVDVYTNVSNITNATSSLRSGQWTHVVFINSNSTSRNELYINGVFTAQGNKYQDDSSNHTYLEVGRDSGGLSYFDAAIDDVRIYNRALSSGEVQQLYRTSYLTTVGHSNTIISNGLVGYWTFDGGSIDWRTNTVRDMSGNGNNGSLAFMSTTTSPVIGKIGSAMNFNGSTNAVDMGNVLHPTGAFTYSAWINQTRIDPADAAPFIMGRYVSGAPETFFGFNAYDGTQLGFWVYTDDTDYIGRIYSGQILQNSWNHVVAVYDGGTTLSAIELYLNGARADDTDDPGGAFTSIPDSGTHLRVGSDVATTYYFPGKIDDVRIYNRALSATEIKQLYNAGR